jgi:hypothetical protein
MRHVLVAAVALAVGLVVGGLRPRAEARRLEADLVELEDQECRPLLGSELVRALRPPPPATDEAPPEPEEEEPDDVDADDLAEGRTILAARRAQARAALIEDADPTDEQLDAFDAAVADMNADLRALGEDLLARVREHGEPSRSELYRLAADGLDVVLVAEARILEAFGDADVDPDALDPLSHLDPSLVDVLVELDRAGFDP